MARNIIVAPQFYKSLNQIADLIGTVYKSKTYSVLENKILINSKKLAINPMIGSKELLLENLLFEYRKFIIKPWFKLIYAFTNDNIYFVDIWDTRQNPDTLIDRVSEINLNTL